MPCIFKTLSSLLWIVLQILSRTALGGIPQHLSTVLKDFLQQATSDLQLGNGTIIDTLF